MTDPTLGQALARLEALDRPVLRDNENAQTRDAAARRAVERFFEDARQHIAYAISQDRRPAPFPLGRTRDGSREAANALSGYHWSRAEPAPPRDNPYYYVWEAFLSWAKSEDLTVTFKEDHDGVGVESWHNLLVSANQAVLGPPPEVAEGSVVIPKEVLARFGSAQAYLDHLQEQVKAKSTGSAHG